MTPAPLQRKSRPPFVMETLEFRSSDAWRSASINVRRLADFLVVEHLKHGGKENGRLKAPYRQLVDWGIRKDSVSAAIREAEELGLVECRRSGMRSATTYTLTWLPLHDGTPPSDRWRTFVAPKPRATHHRKIRRGLEADRPTEKIAPANAAYPSKRGQISSKDGNLLPEKGVNLPPEAGAATPRSGGRSDHSSPQSGGRLLPPEAGDISRKLYQGADEVLDERNGVGSDAVGGRLTPSTAATPTRAAW